MGSKGRVPPPHLRRPLPGPGIVHPDPFHPAVHPPSGGFLPYDALTPPEVMEQKLAGQHVEIRKLATENQRLAATHGTLRQELAASQHEVRLLHTHINAMKSERELQAKGLMDKIGRMESELQAAESIKVELQQARAEAQLLVTARQELISKVQNLNHDLEIASSELQQMPPLFFELEALRQEYQHCRATYDHEKKLYNDHLEHLQAMEKNYMTMISEVEKLRENLANSANVDRRTGGPYGGSSGYNENSATGSYPVGQNPYTDGYTNLQGGSPLTTGVTGGGAAFPAASIGAATGPGGNPQVATQPGPASARTPYDVSKGAGHDASRGPGPVYDVQRGPSTPAYNGQRGAITPGQDAQRGALHHTQRGPAYGLGYEMQMAHGHYDVNRAAGYGGQRAPPVYDAQRIPGYDAQKRSNYETSKGPAYDASSRGTAGLQGQVPPGAPANAPYASAAPLTLPGTGYEVPSRGGNTVHR